MEKAIGDMHLLQVIIYLDDIIMFGRTLEENEERLLDWIMWQILIVRSTIGLIHINKSCVLAFLGRCGYSEILMFRPAISLTQ